MGVWDVVGGRVWCGGGLVGGDGDLVEVCSGIGNREVDDMQGPIGAPETTGTCARGIEQLLGC